MSEIITPSKKIIVLKPINLSAVGGSVLIISSTDAKEKPMIGEVLVIGSGKKPMPLKKGDIVAYRRFGDTTFLIKGMEYAFVGFDDILGVIKK